MTYIELCLLCLRARLLETLTTKFGFACFASPLNGETLNLFFVIFYLFYAPSPYMKAILVGPNQIQYILPS